MPLPPPPKLMILVSLLLVLAKLDIFSLFPDDVSTICGYFLATVLVLTFIILADVGALLGDAGEIGTCRNSSVTFFSLSRVGLGLAGSGLSSRGSLETTVFGWRSRSCLKDFLREVVVAVAVVEIGAAPLDLPTLAVVGLVRSRGL